ncbi:MAG: S1C family serine protease, partial [Gemmatimonadota bacterium]|nr:S1C family serine protease [Gemmatimonadota bacterium]
GPMSNSDPGSSGESLHAFSDALANAVSRVAPSIVAIHARRRIPASGIVWRAGYVIASDHTIRRERDITVTLEDGRQLPASLVGRDPSTDLALLKLSDDTVPVAPRTANSGATALRPGHVVLAVGRPGEKVTATLGAVHTVGSEWRTWQGGQISELIRVDMAVHDGFSGSALVDSSGNVVGINSSILTRGAHASSIVIGISINSAVLARTAPASIPIATIDRVVDQLISGGRVPRGWLGVGTQAVRLPERVRADASLSQEVGLLLVGVAADSPAERAGLFVGDTLLSLAGTPTREADDVLAILGPDTVGRTLTARIVRAGAVVELPVVIGESPHAAPSGGNGPGGSGGGQRGGDGGGERGGTHGDRHHDQNASRCGTDLFAARNFRGWERAFRQSQNQSPAEAIEQLRKFAGSFGFGFAQGCGPRRPH